MHKQKQHKTAVLWHNQNKSPQTDLLSCPEDDCQRWSQKHQWNIWNSSRLHHSWEVSLLAAVSSHSWGKKKGKNTQKVRLTVSVPAGGLKGPVREGAAEGSRNRCQVTQNPNFLAHFHRTLQASAAADSDTAPLRHFQTGGPDFGRQKRQYLK